MIAKMEPQEGEYLEGDEEEEFFLTDEEFLEKM